MFSLPDPSAVVWLPRRRGGPARFDALWPDVVEDLRQVRLADGKAMQEDGAAPEPGASSASFPHAA
jgi:hypothetical protein